MTHTTIKISALVVGALLILAGILLRPGGVGANGDTSKEESLEKVMQIEADRDLVVELAAEEAGVELAPEDSEFQRVRASIDWTGAPEPFPERVDGQDFELFVNVTAEFLLFAFEKMGYTGDQVESGETTAIPPLILVSIPEGWAEDRTVQFKKSMFYRVILPLVLYENEAVLDERAQVLELRSSLRNGEPLSERERDWLREIAVKYQVLNKDDTTPVGLEHTGELLLRVDIVPPSLALGQAAYESGYATSRFAHQGNALFGQWDWSSDAIKPAEQRSGMGNYGIKAFEYPIDSVRAYIWNLNTHYRYEDFRRLREQQRGGREGLVKLDGIELAGGLLAYSERGQDYVDDLRGMMRFNRLHIADDLRLLQGEPIYFD